jgi:hypothetical protein
MYSIWLGIELLLPFETVDGLRMEVQTAIELCHRNT